MWMIKYILVPKIGDILQLYKNILELFADIYTDDTSKDKSSCDDYQLITPPSYRHVRDELETGYANIIPLWLFGFLY